jgi:DedD protein
MSLFSIFSKKQSEVTSVAEALAATNDSPPKARSRKPENRHAEAQNEQLVPEKKRARRRLIGAVAMVLAVVIGLPMVLDSEPKPINKNIAIQIPSKETTTASLDSKEELVPEDVLDQSATKHPLPSPITVPAPLDVAAAKPEFLAKPIKSEVKSESKSQTKIEPKLDAKSESKTETRHVSEAPAKKEPVAVIANKPDAKNTAHVTSSEESARAMAILGGADPSSTASKTRIVVQVGAFATQEKVNELQTKLASAGIKSFTQKVATSSGDKIRVRIGPFNDKESADKVKSQLEKIGLNGSLISL